jgi:hypothetical protein
LQYSTLKLQVFDPFSHRIIAIGLKAENDEKIFYGNNEKEILEEFWKEVGNFNLLVGWGIGNFDAQFIRIRSLKNKIKVKDLSRKVVDMMHLLCDPFKWHSLDSISQFLGIGLKETLGQTIPELFEKQDWDSILKYFKKDLALIEIVYKEMRTYGFFD